MMSTDHEVSKRHRTKHKFRCGASGIRRAAPTPTCFLQAGREYPARTNEMAVELGAQGQKVVLRLPCDATHGLT